MIAVDDNIICSIDLVIAFGDEYTYKNYHANKSYYQFQMCESI